MIWFIIWAIGAILAFGLVYSEYLDIVNKINTIEQYRIEHGKILIGTFLSWITIFYIMYRIHKELKEEENLWNK